MRAIKASLCFVVATFCVFGFMATFEPLEGSSPLIFRLVYAIGGLAALWGLVRAFFTGPRGGDRGSA